MLKRLGILLLAAGLLIGCALPTPAEPFRLGEAPWRDGERTIYDVLGRDGQRVGEATWTWMREGDGWLLGYRSDLSGSVTEGETHLAADLLPERGWRASGGRRVEAEYGDDTVVITTTAADGTTTTREVDRKATTLDNEQTLQTQRALPLAADYRTGYSNLVAASGAQVAMTISVVGREQVTVPAGTFAAWRVEMRSGSATHDAWYSVEAPHLLLRYVNRASGAEFRLRAWQESEDAPLEGTLEIGPDEAPAPVGWQRPAMNWPYLLTSVLVQIPLMVVLPLLAGWYLTRRTGATWGVFWAGALTFVISQVVHLPLNWALGLLGETARGVALWPLSLVAVVAGLSAGLCESVARWVALRYAMRRTRGFENAVQFGLGHGGVEAVLLGLIALSGLVNILALWRSDPVSLGMNEAQQAQIVAAFAELDLVGWYMPVLAGLERVFALCLHVAMSVLVMDGVTRQKPINLLWAVLAHAAVDAWAVYSVNTWGAVWSEVGLAVAAGLCVWYVLRTARQFGAEEPAL